MGDQITIEQFKSELFECLDETFEQTHGIYLDKGTSFFDTLENISAEDASCTAIVNGATITAHIQHIIFYLDVLDATMRNQKVSKIDWKELWQNARKITPEEWQEQKHRLRESYRKVLATIKNYEHWESQYGIAGSLAVLAHSAYHLGAIRQALVVIKSNKNQMPVTNL